MQPPAVHQHGHEQFGSLQQLSRKEGSAYQACGSGIVITYHHLSFSRVCFRSVGKGPSTACKQAPPTLEPQHPSLDVAAFEVRSILRCISLHSSQHPPRLSQEWVCTSSATKNEVRHRMSLVVNNFPALMLVYLCRFRLSSFAESIFIVLADCAFLIV